MRTHRASLLLALITLAVGMGFPQPSRAVGLSDLGEAARFAAFGFESLEIPVPIDEGVIVKSATITGDVGVGNGSSSKFDKGTIDGDLYVHSQAGTPDIHTKDFTITGSILMGGTVDALLEQAAMDAVFASMSFSALGGTALGNLTGNVVLNGNGGLNVFSAADVDFDKKSLTLFGGANDFFVFNVSGDFDFSEAEIILVGISEDQVVFNVLGDSPHISISKKGSIFRGTVLATGGKIDFKQGQLFGSLIGNEVKMHKGARLTHAAAPMPEPSAALLLLVGFAVVRSAVSRRAAR